MMPAYPVRRRVGAYVRGSRGTGVLTIAPGEITLELDWWLRRLKGVERVIHTEPDVTVVLARLTHGVSIWLEGRDANAAAGVGFALTHELERLRAAGFSPHVQRRWIWMGTTGPP